MSLCVDFYRHDIPFAVVMVRDNNSNNNKKNNNDDDNDDIFLINLHL